jgi:two-component system, NtrC family, sensor kinase
VQALAEAVLEAACNAGVGVIVSFDAGTLFRNIYVSDAAARILGRASDALLGQETLHFFAPDERPRVADLLGRWQCGLECPSHVETVVVRDDGLYVPVEVAFSLVTLEGEPAIVTFVRDISERRIAEDRIRDSEQRFRQLIEAAPEAIGVYRAGRLTYLNPAFIALIGYPFQQLVSRELVEFIHNDDRTAACRQLEVAVNEKSPTNPLEYRFVHADGRTLYVETVAIPIDYQGQTALLCFTRDTTERKLLQSHLALNDRMSTLGMLAAGVAHEINNPLGYLALNIEELIRHLKQLAPPDVMATIAPVADCARDGLARMATIVRDLQRLTTPNSTERWPVELKEVFESALNVAMPAIRGRARIVRRFCDVPAIRTDPTRLGQILLNLVFNAAQSFMLPDERNNIIEVAIADGDTHDVLISVSDNGTGIAQEHLDRVFEPFFTTKQTGSGLGLAICQTLATSLGSRLTVRSVLGEGTQFTLRLPIRAERS